MIKVGIIFFIISIFSRLYELRQTYKLAYEYRNFKVENSFGIRARAITTKVSLKQFMDIYAIGSKHFCCTDCYPYFQQKVGNCSYEITVLRFNMKDWLKYQVWRKKNICSENEESTIENKARDKAQLERMYKVLLGEIETTRVKSEKYIEEARSTTEKVLRNLQES